MLQRSGLAFALTASVALSGSAGCDEFTIVTGCADHIQSAGETDIDCGGSCEKPCALGKHCEAASDCVAGDCIEGLCSPSPPPPPSPPPLATWSEVTSADGAMVPPARQGHALAYDPTLNKLLLFGGEDAQMTYTDTWQWDDQGWNRVDATAADPPSGRSPTLVSDGKRLILFGGSSDAPSADTFAWNGGTWGKLMPSKSPGARFQAVASYDITRDEMVLYGGYATTPLGDTWIWKNNDWTQSDMGGPPSRAGATMAYDAAAKMTVLFGGSAAEQPLPSGVNDTWTWDGKTWLTLSKLAGSPPPRYGAAMAYDSARKRVVLFGGMDKGVALNDTWEWDGAAWSEVKVESPPEGRVWSAMTYDPVKGRVLLFGGSPDQTTTLDDLWEYR